MKKLFLISVLLLFPGFVSASPFLVCDPQAGVTSYKLTGPGWVPLTVPAQPDGSLKLDVSGSNQGSNSITVVACIVDPIWGEVCSSSVPFVFIRPVIPGTPGNFRLIP